ncbi:hypothetical protein [Saccharolobus islandicus]|uniref:Uncharacterized protein n=1 Tax=Saccharolobus islandicus (strain L.D.8.5 / Lassen \|nr:hypothetical protein [Sulfolobus islandicus]ADB87212.1 hypothetical protein LD85_1545 [Sulfolobus islandicus L.D.8.5]
MLNNAPYGPGAIIEAFLLNASNKRFSMLFSGFEKLKRTGIDVLGR